MVTITPMSSHCLAARKLEAMNDPPRFEGCGEEERKSSLLVGTELPGGEDGKSSQDGQQRWLHSRNALHATELHV